MRAGAGLALCAAMLVFRGLAQAEDAATFATRNLPHVVVLGGGVIIEGGGQMLGAIGVSGAPGGEADEACAKAGIAAIQESLEF